jgi:protein-S-isoprenylcysteine O-methyltransferase Ste14
MRRSAAAVASVVLFVAAPCVVAGLVPWLITSWQMLAPMSPFAAIVAAVGGVLLVLAIAVLVSAFARFVVEGRGTPAPIAPPDRLVVGGDYRFVRNPMYLGLITAILGQAMIFGSVGLLLYAVIVWAMTAAFVHWYEEPVLLERYGRRLPAVQPSRTCLATAAAPLLIAPLAALAPRGSR